ncbi:MAG: SOS response-associated peptidase [Phycisphaeraceae bacterium]|nr:SOS response-associated peptidase [Phycisphaeraceae bacterium]
MCGRYTHLFTWAELHRLMSLGNLTPQEQQEIEKALKKRYNVAPQQQAPVIITDGPLHRLEFFRWGLIPFWSKDASIANRTINARSETIASSPAFREAFKKHRCLVPASGFYGMAARRGLDAQAALVHPRAPEDGILFFAGVFDEWTPPDASEPLRTFSILQPAKRAHASVAHAHARRADKAAAEPVARCGFKTRRSCSAPRAQRPLASRGLSRRHQGQLRAFRRSRMHPSR